MIRSPMSLNAAVCPETYATAGAALVAAGTTSFRSRPTSSSVAWSCGAELGVTKTIATVFSLLNCGLRTDATPFRPCTPSVDALRRLLIALHVDHDRDRPVETGAEAFGEQVVRTAAVCFFGCVPWSAAPSRTSADVPARTMPATSRTGNMGRAFAVTNRPHRAISVFSRAASESSIGARTAP